MHFCLTAQYTPQSLTYQDNPTTVLQPAQKSHRTPWKIIDTDRLPMARICIFDCLTPCRPHFSLLALSIHHAKLTRL